MEPVAIKAYDSLVPTDQLIIDSMIIALQQKDKRIRELCDHILVRMDTKGSDDASKPT